METDNHIYKYNKHVEMLPLAMMGDLLGEAECGHDSLALNVFLNTQIE